MNALGIFGLVLLVLILANGLVEAARFETALAQATSLRHIILSNDAIASQKFCKNPNSALHWQWREEGIWTDVCSSFTGFSKLPRFWKVQLKHKYKLLFTCELPITVTIVILS